MAFFIYDNDYRRIIKKEKRLKFRFLLKFLFKNIYSFFLEYGLEPIKMQLKHLKHN